MPVNTTVDIKHKGQKVCVGRRGIVVDLETGPIKLPVTPMPRNFIDWIDQGRKATYDGLLNKDAPVRFFHAHLPVIVTYSKNGTFPFNCTNKGIGFIPKEKYLSEFIELFQETLRDTRGKPWRQSLEERVRTVSKFYFDHEKIDYRALSGLEIFTKNTFQNLNDTPLASLHFTGPAPDFISFQLNCAVEVIDQDDPRHTFIVLVRTMFEYDDFHIAQPQFPFAYIYWISEVVDKTPHRVQAQDNNETRIEGSDGIHWHPEAAQAVVRAPKMIRQFIRDQIENYALERGFSEINLELVQEARKNFEGHAKRQSTSRSQPSINRYRRIFTAVDGSELSDGAMRLAVQIGKVSDAELFGCHVYAAKLHDRRFRAMEGGLPEKYQEEEELEKQRSTHDSLITDGLELITDSYLEIMSNLCRENGLPFTGISIEGRNWQALAREVNSHDYDLIALGGHGVGRVAPSLLGTVTERVLRRVRRDILICKKTEAENHSDEIVVCLDGSSRSWGALIRAIQLAKAFKKKITAISAFDPYFHYTMFKLLNGVLSDKARDVFKFEEQEKLHEDIIDSGLAKIYQSHLSIAEKIAVNEGVSLQTRLLDGKAFEKILEFVTKTSPWLLVMGRIGIHSDEEMDIGGNTENICRLAPCNLLIVDTQFKPPIELQAEETVTWTNVARTKMSKIPPMAQGVATKAIQNYCLAEGYTVVTDSVLNAAIKELLPPEAIERMGITFDEEPDTEQSFNKIVLSFKCEKCGHVHHGSRPQMCPICGKEGKEFKLIESAKAKDGVAVDSLGERQLIWEKSCLRKLEKIENPVLRRQIKAKLEKQALTRRLSTITVEMFRECAGTQYASDETSPVWTDAAIKRLERVPEGFMRTAAQNTVEEYSKENDITEITLEVAESGLVKAREKMAAAMQGRFGRSDSYSHSDNDKRAEIGSFECAMCGYIVDGKEPPRCPSCKVDQLEKLTEHERRAATEVAAMILEWDKEALERIERIPAGFMRQMTRCRIEQWARKYSHNRVTLDVVEAKYKSWAEGSRGLECEMTWSADARSRIEKIPEFIRPMVMKEIERYAKSSGNNHVDNAVIDGVMDSWGDFKVFHKESQ